MIMEQAAPARPAPDEVRRVKLSACLAVANALLAIVVVSADALSPSPYLVLGAQALSLLSALFAAYSLLLGTRLLVRRNPPLRRTFAVLGVLTLGTLLAHLYIIGNPPAATGSTISGPANGSFGDAHLSVSSVLVGPTLRMHFADIGTSANDTSQAIGKISVSLNGVPLDSSAIRPDPSYGSPLEPGSSGPFGFQSEADGTWAVHAGTGSQITVYYEYLTCFHTPTASDPRGVFGCIMDESYYVPSAIGLLSGSQCAPFADSCNLEHPPLAKAMIAAGIAAFGLNDFGWRISEVVLGTLSIPLLFALVYTLTGDRRISIFASLIFAADTLFFIHSSAALIDVPAVFFSLLGFILFLRPGRIFRLNNYVGAGILFGLAALSKETAVFAIGAAVTYEALFGSGGRRASLTRIAQVVGPAFLVFAGGVQLYDSLFTSASLPWFYNHVSFMLTYGASLRSGGWCLYGGSCPKGPFITPLNWLIVYTPVSYLVTAITVSATQAATSFAYVTVGYYGVANDVVVWMVYLWLPVVLYSLAKGRRWRGSASKEDKLGAFLAVWFLWSYLPYVALWVYGRVTYPFYFLPAIPALAAGAAYFITRPWFPRKMALVYVIAAFAIFFLYFPVKDFLPTFVRALLGH